MFNGQRQNCFKIDISVYFFEFWGQVDQGKYCKFGNYEVLWKIQGKNGQFVYFCCFRSGRGGKYLLYIIVGNWFGKVGKNIFKDYCNK